MGIAMLPYVVSTDPPNGVAEIPTSQVVRVVFNTDIDVSTLISIFANEQATGNRIPINVDYKDMVATIRPEPMWTPNTVYRITIAGDDVLDPEKKFTGIQSILGYPMAGSFTVTFRTVFNPTLLAPDISLVSPTDESVVTGETITFTWPVVANAERYEFEISQFNNLDPYTWRGIVTKPEVTPDIVLEDKTYYWRVRAIDAAGNTGDWCGICTFGVKNTPDNPVTPEDLYNDEVLVLPEEIVTFPDPDWVNVALNLRTITAIVPAGVLVDEALLSSAIKITTQDAFNEIAPVEEVDQTKYNVATQAMNDGSTMIIITLGEVI